MFTAQKMPTIVEITEECLDQDDTFLQELTAVDDEEILMFASLNISRDETPRFDYSEKMFATALSHSLLPSIQVENNSGPKIAREPTPMPELASPSPLTVSSTPSPEFFIFEEAPAKDQLQSNLEFKQIIQQPERSLFLSASFNQSLSSFHFLSNDLEEEGKEEVLQEKYKAIAYYQPMDEQGGISYETKKRAKIK